MNNLVVSLHIAYNCPQRIGITIVDTTTAQITSNSYVKPPAFQNYLEYCILRAFRVAQQRGLPFSLEHVAIWLADVSHESVIRAHDRVTTRLFDEGYAAANDGQPESTLWHPKQREGFKAYWEKPALVIS